MPNRTVTNAGGVAVILSGLDGWTHARTCKVDLGCLHVCRNDDDGCRAGSLAGTTAKSQEPTKSHSLLSKLGRTSAHDGVS